MPCPHQPPNRNRNQWWNAGDDGKLLRCAHPLGSEILVYGREADDATLRAEVAEGNAVLLYPGDGALEVSQLAALGIGAPPCRAGGTGEGGGGAEAAAPLLRVVVLDSTWNRVKAMRKVRVEPASA